MHWWYSISVPGHSLQTVHKGMAGIIMKADCIEIVEVTNDSEIGMICAGYVRLASFLSREAFEVSEFRPSLPPPYRATSNNSTFDIWADDPQFKDDPPQTIITEWVPAKADRTREVSDLQ